MATVINGRAHRAQVGSMNFPNEPIVEIDSPAILSSARKASSPLPLCRRGHDNFPLLKDDGIKSNSQN
jgi:hypothetical protein